MGVSIVAGTSELITISGLNVSFKAVEFEASVISYDYSIRYNSSRGTYYISGGQNWVVSTKETVYRDTAGEKATKETYVATENGYEGDGPATFVSSFLLGEAITDVTLSQDENNQLTLVNTRENVNMVLQSQS